MKLGVSHNGQKFTCRKTIRTCARSVLVALWDHIDEKATMHVVHQKFLPTFEAWLMIPHIVVFACVEIHHG